MAIRVTAIVRGRVQRAGFRDFIQLQADEAGVTGSARNLPDGTVEIVAEGAEPAVAGFLAAVKGAGPPVRIAGLETRRGPATGEFGDFVVHREPHEFVGDKIEAGFRFVKEMDAHLLQMDRNLSGKLDHVGATLGAKIDASSASLGAKIDASRVSLGEKIDASAASLGTKIDSLGACLGAKVDAVGKAVASVGAKVDAVGDKITGMGAGIAGLGSRLEGLATAQATFVTQTDRHFEALASRYDRISKDLHAILLEFQAERRESRAMFERLFTLVVEQRAPAGQSAKKAK